MSGAVYFVQECPTCGRTLQIRLEYLGRTVACMHCQGTFQASPEGLSGRRVSDSTELILRADQLLASIDSRRADEGRCL